MFLPLLFEISRRVTRRGRRLRRVGVASRVVPAVASCVDPAAAVNVFSIVRTVAVSRDTKGGSITVQLTSCLTGLESAVFQLTIFVFICKTD
jgi:hypothetical protein